MTIETGLSKEQAFFLEVLSAYIHGTVVSLPENIDLALLKTIVQKQQLAAVVYSQTALPDLRNAFSVSLYYEVNREKLTEQIDRAFREERIPYLIFKGSEIAQYYRHPYHRLSGDIDILVKACDREKTGSVLQRIGFKVRQNNAADHEWVYTKGQFEVELHHRLLYDDELNNSQLTAFTDRVWEHTTSVDGIRYRMETEFHFIFLLLHLRKHLLWAGAGIRQLVDLALMLKNAEPDFAKIQKYIEACGILPFAGICFALIERQFGCRCPIPPAPLTDTEFTSLFQALFSGGVFGDMSGKATENLFISQTVRKDGMIASVLYVLFPPWTLMRERYPQMSQSKILLPLLWFRRILDSFTKRSFVDGISYTAKHLFPKITEKEREKKRNQWGL